MKFSHLICALLLANPLAALADMSLDGVASSLTFVSVKNAAVAEVSRFTGLSGTVAEDGQVNLVIDAASVATNIDIRDQRMREHLLEVVKFPEATVGAKVDLAAIRAMPVGARQSLTLPVTVTLHGASQQYTATLDVVKLAGGVQVSTTAPLIIKLADFDLLPGVDKLQALAGLASIAVQVPVSAVLVFR